MTATDHARFAEWDAAYVLGALSPAERREFEDHLDDCDRCRAAVAELSALPGLLGRLGEARAFALLDGDDESTAPPADLVARIERADRVRRVRRRVLSIGGIAAAAVLASVLTLVVPAIVAPPSQPTETVAFAAAAEGVPVEATAELSRLAWGTSIRMTCDYRAADPAAGDYGPVQYALWITDSDGTESALSTWSSGAGSHVVVTAGTAVDLDDIARLEVRDASGERVLLDVTL